MSELFAKVLNMSLTASVIILCVMLARLCLKRAPKAYSYALWAVVLFRLLCPVSLMAPVSLLEFTGPEVTESAGITSTVSYIPAEYVYQEPSRESAVNARPVQTQAEEKTEADISPMSVASYVWVFGTALMALHSALSYLNLRRRLIGAVRYRGETWLADHIDSPFALGLFRPRIYLPSDTPMVERRYIIAHERHHIRRGDHILKLLAYAALCIHWFNPLVWTAFILAGKDMEMSCDEAVIKKLGSHIRADYSASLLRLATGRKIIAGTPLAFGEGDTKGRVMNMAKWKKPKVWVSVLCVIACIAVLVACGVNPEKPASAEVQADPLGSCKQVLQSVQSSDGYRILTERQNSGANVLNDTSRIRDWKYKDTWLQLSKIPESGWVSYFAYLSRDGKYYDNVSTPGGRDENGHLLWSESTNPGSQEPWLATFRWDDKKVELLSTEEIETHWEETHTLVHLAVTDHWELGDAATEEYTVDFQFDAKGEFYCAVVTADFHGETMGTFGIVNTMYVQTLDGAAVKQEIEAYYQEDITSLAFSTDGSTVTYGDFSVTLPEGYDYRESAGAGLVLTKNGEDVGGITHWAAPDFALSSSNMSQWVQALGVLEAMGDEAYMIDGWSGTYLTAFYIDEEDPLRVNVNHHFFEAGEVVYDLWFNKNILPDSEGTKFLNTAAIAGEPGAAAKTDDTETVAGNTVAVDIDFTEEQAFEKCRAVLDLVQSGSCQLAVEELTADDTHWSATQFFQSGENWLQIIDIDPETENIVDGEQYSVRMAFLNANGVRYSNEGHWGKAYSDIEWTENESFNDSVKPWLARYAWNGDNVALMGCLNNEEGECVMLRIDEPYADREDYDPHYFVNFNFDTAGNFVNVQIIVNLYQDNEFTETISIITLDPETVAAEIDKEYRRAIG